MVGVLHGRGDLYGQEAGGLMRKKRGERGGNEGRKRG